LKGLPTRPYPEKILPSPFSLALSKKLDHSFIVFHKIADFVRFSDLKLPNVEWIISSSHKKKAAFIQPILLVPDCN